MDPVSIALLAGAGVQLASGISQWFSSRAAQQASDEELQRMQELLEKVQSPDFDINTITPEEFKVVASYTPELVPIIEEKAPQMVKAYSAGAVKGRDAQRSVLDRLMSQSESGTDPMYQLAQNMAARNAAGTAASNRASLTDQFARRGAMNSGLQFAGNMAAVGDAQTAQALSGQQSAADQFARQQAAMGQAADLGGQMYSQDVDLEKINAGIINSFNQRAAENAMRANEYNAGQRWNAQLANQNLSQNVADKNVTARNVATYDNRDYGNQMKQQQYDNEMNKIGVQSGQSQAAQQSAYNNAALRNQGISAIGQGIGGAASTYADYKTRENAAQQPKYNETPEWNEYQSWRKQQGYKN